MKATSAVFPPFDVLIPDSAVTIVTGAIVGASVGSAVGSAVGASVGSAVGSGVAVV